MKINAKKWMLIIVCLLIGAGVLFCAGAPEKAARQTVFSSGTPDTAPQRHPPGQLDADLTENAFVPAAIPTLIPPQKTLGNGEIAYGDGAVRLNKTQEQLLLDYMNHYFGSLGELTVRNPSALFSADAEEQVENDRYLLAVLCGIRSAQQTDLSLSGYSFTLTVQTVTDREGDIRVRASEDSIQNFTAYPGVDSKSFGVVHTFLLTDTSAGWRLKEHQQSGSLNRLVRGLGRWQPGAAAPTLPASNTNMAAQVKTLLKNARSDTALRQTQGSAEALVFDHGYDRVAAAAYAAQWVDQRNDSWPSYDRYGGNCQNFTSQALLAGGIPMDSTAPGQWKWYGDTPNGSFVASGRSPAWSGVGEFLSYVQDNRGYGLVAYADAPYYSGEVGDIIHLGVDGDWRHTVIIIDVITDTAGNTVDYLVASNTANLLHFPASAYYYTQQMLIKIYGWND